MDRKGDTTTLAVHRCRFVDYAPSAITALAYPPLPLPSVKGKKKLTTGKESIKFGILAVGHANGNIDLCEWVGNDRERQCPQAWVVRKVRRIFSSALIASLTFACLQTLPGPYPSKVDSLAFAIRYPDDLDPEEVPKQSDLRLFSSGGGSELVEWDLERGCIRVRIRTFDPCLEILTPYLENHKLSRRFNLVYRSQPLMHISRAWLRRRHHPYTLRGERHLDPFPSFRQSEMQNVKSCLGSTCTSTAFTKETSDC